MYINTWKEKHHEEKVFKETNNHWRPGSGAEKAPQKFKGHTKTNCGTCWIVWKLYIMLRAWNISHERKNAFNIHQMLWCRHWWFDKGGVINDKVVFWLYRIICTDTTTYEVARKINITRCMCFIHDCLYLYNNT